MPNLARFVLTADDYALTPGVSAGILDLLEAGRIAAAGAMTNRPHWRSGAAVFGQFSGAADLGLHFNLTCGIPLTRMKRLAPAGELPKLPALLRGGVAGPRRCERGISFWRGSEREGLQDRRHHGFALRSLRGGAF